MTPWLLLVGAIVAEVIATTFLKQSDGFSRLWPSVATVVGYAVAFALLAQALKRIEVGVAYAIWSGLGTALITLVGIVLLGESATAVKLGGIALIVAGVVLLNLGTAS